MKKLLCEIDRITGKYLRYFLIVLMVGVSFLVVLQVFLRYVLRMPMQSTEEVLMLVSVWLYYVGAVNASREEGHINARILEIFSDKVRYICSLRLISACISVVVTLWLSYWAYDFLQYSIRRAKISMILKYPLVLVESALFICMVPMFIYACAETYRYARCVITGSMEGVNK